jgi:hypothetical protein
MYRDDFERLAHDIACVVMYGKIGGEVRQPLMERVAAMLRKGPGITTWPKDHAEACQRARDEVLRRATAVAAFKPPVKVPAMPQMPVATVVKVDATSVVVKPNLGHPLAPILFPSKKP